MTEKEEQKKQASAIKEELETTHKFTGAETLKAYELFRCFIVGKVLTQSDKIVQEMHCKDPWVSVNRQSCKGLCARTWMPFKDCIELHKLTVFPADASEKQCFYMQPTIKKLQRVTVHQHMSRMGMLNDYLAYLPMIYDWSLAVEGTKKSNVLFDKAELDKIMLNSSVLVTWVNQYSITHSTLPKSPCVLLMNLEAIELVMNEKHQANLNIKANEASTASASAKGNPKKCSASRSPDK
jgi:hypothetical protein